MFQLHDSDAPSLAGYQTASCSLEGGSVKHTVVSGIFGFTMAILAVLNVSFLRRHVFQPYLPG